MLQNVQKKNEFQCFEVENLGFLPENRIFARLLAYCALM